MGSDHKNIRKTSERHQELSRTGWHSGFQLHTRLGRWDMNVANQIARICRDVTAAIAVLVIQIVSSLHAFADSAAVSPNQIVEKSFLVYQIGSNVPYSGLVASIRYDGSKAYEENYIGGKMHGSRTEWDRLGNKISEITYKNGTKNGPETSWYLSGQTASESTFTDGFPSGRMTRWYENGQLWSDVNADLDRQVATSTTWYESGQKQCEAIIAKGEPPKRTAWDKNGHVLELDHEAFLTHCNSWAGAAMLRPGERSVYVTGDLDRMTRYSKDSTNSDKNTITVMDVSDSWREQIKSGAKSASECGLPLAMSH